MELKEKDLFEKKAEKEQPRKPYTAPQLTVHGTVEEITGGKGAILTDGGLAGSLIV